MVLYRVKNKNRSRRFVRRDENSTRRVVRNFKQIEFQCFPNIPLLRNSNMFLRNTVQRIQYTL